MKDKSRVTLMFFTAIDGEKVPLCVIGKSKNPHCFRQVIGKALPMGCFCQKNVWFGRDVRAFYNNLI